MTKLEFTRSDEKAEKILQAVRMIDEGKELVPVRHGRWIKDKDGFHHCSECGENTDRQEDAFGYDISEFKTIYCGNCGAEMYGRK